MARQCPFGIHSQIVKNDLAEGIFDSVNGIQNSGNARVDNH
jgi:hypothetical protein